MYNYKKLSCMVAHLGPSNVRAEAVVRSLREAAAHVTVSPSSALHGSFLLSRVRLQGHECLDGSPQGVSALESALWSTRVGLSVGSCETLQASGCLV